MSFFLLCSVFPPLLRICEKKFILINRLAKFIREKREEESKVTVCNFVCCYCPLKCFNRCYYDCCLTGWLAVPSEKYLLFYFNKHDTTFVTVPFSLWLSLSHTLTVNINAFPRVILLFTRSSFIYCWLFLLLLQTKSINFLL